MRAYIIASALKSASLIGLIFCYRHIEVPSFTAFPNGYFSRARFALHQRIYVLSKPSNSRSKIPFCRAHLINHTRSVEKSCRTDSKQKQFLFSLSDLTAASISCPMLSFPHLDPMIMGFPRAHQLWDGIQALKAHYNVNVHILMRERVQSTSICVLSYQPQHPASRRVFV